MPRAPYSQGPCATCGAHRLLKYVRTAPCALATSAKGSIGAAPGTACRWRCGRCGRADIKRHPGPGAPQASRPAGVVRLEAGLARSTRLLLASTPYRTPPTNAPAVCIACSCVPLHSGARRPACMQHKQTAHRVAVHRAAASLSTAQRARGRVPCVAGVTTLDSGTRVALLQIIRASHSPASNGACQHLPSGGVNTFEHLSAVVLTVNV